MSSYAWVSRPSPMSTASALGWGRLHVQPSFEPTTSWNGLLLVFGENALWLRWRPTKFFCHQMDTCRRWRVAFSNVESRESIDGTVVLLPMKWIIRAGCCMPLRKLILFLWPLWFLLEWKMYDQRGEVWGWNPTVFEMQFEDLSGEMKRYHCCIGFADDLNFVAIAVLLNFDVFSSARQKGSPGSLCFWFCTLLELGCSSCCWDLCWRRGASCIWDAFWMNRARLNLKFNTPLKPWISLQCFGSYQSWMWWWSLAEEFLGCSKFSCFPSRIQMSLGFGV